MTYYTMKDALSVATPDYATDFSTLGITPQNIFTEQVTRNQTVHYFDDSSAVVIERGAGNPRFIVTLQLPVLTQTQANALFDWFNDPAKADGRNRTFKFTHPTDTHVYVVRFVTDINRALSAGVYSYATIQFLVEGYVS